jgi:hypothetical protein
MSALRQANGLSDLDNVTVRVADVAANLAVLFLRLRDELGSSTFHNSWHARISATRIFRKLLTLSKSAGTLSVTDGLPAVGPPPTLTISQVFAI